MIGARLLVEFEIPDIPPSLANHRGHWGDIYATGSRWLELAIHHGRAARMLADVPPAVSGDRRRVEIVQHRTHLLDPGNLEASVKAIVDGLKLRHARRVKGIRAELSDLWGAGLIFDDGPAHLDLVVTQAKARHRAEQRTEVKVFAAFRQSV